MEVQEYAQININSLIKDAMSYYNLLKINAKIQKIPKISWDKGKNNMELNFNQAAKHFKAH